MPNTPKKKPVGDSGNVGGVQSSGETIAASTPVGKGIKENSKPKVEDKKTNRKIKTAR